MKKLFSLVVLGFSLVSLAQFKPGQGVANDHATGANPRDVTFIARGGGQAYGYRSYDTVLGFTFLPWAAPNFESTVKGVRFNLGWGDYAGCYGFDFGAFSGSGDFGGLAINWFGNAVTRDAAGVQIGLVNYAGGRAAGLQIGLVNYVDRLAGVQIGLLNFAVSQWTLPFINIAW